MQSRTSQRLIYLFGISMAALMAVSLILPALTPQTTLQTVDPAEPTNTPLPPTLPPPPEDFSDITLGDSYLHPTGLFSVDLPSGWDPLPDVASNPNFAQVNLNNPELVSIVAVGIENPPNAIEDQTALNDYFTENRLAQSWRQYASWAELGRPTVIGEDDVLIDFALVDQEGRSLRARQKVWTDGDWIYFVRVVVPENALDLMFHMVDLMDDAVVPYTQFQETAITWISYYDSVNQFILRHPTTWSVTDGAPGRPASFLGDMGEQMRVDVIADTSVDEDAAVELVSGLAPDAEIVSVNTITRNGGDGFSIAYSFADFQGNPQSGIALLLNGETGALYLANAVLAEGDVDMNDPADNARFINLRDALNTFSLLTTLQLPEPTPTPTGTPFPTLTPAPDEVEVTPEATDDGEAMDDAEETEEASDNS